MHTLKNSRPKVIVSLLMFLIAAEAFFIFSQYQKFVSTKENNRADWLGRPTLLNLDNAWILVYRKARFHSLDPQSSLHIRFSEDQGKTWTREDTFLNGRSIDGFPIIPHPSKENVSGIVDASEGELVKTPNGTLLLLVREEGTPHNGTYVWRSRDKGAHWEEEGKINSDNTLLMGGQVVNVGNDLYGTFWVDENADYDPPFRTTLYRSSDDGISWVHVSDVTLNGTGESALMYLGGSEFLTVMGDDSKGEKTYLRRSFDLGKTWGMLQDATSIFGALQRPKLQLFADEPNRLYLYGRNQLGEVDDYTVLYYSNDKGATWSNGFYLDTTSYADTGYATLAKREDGTFYMLSYGGNSEKAEIKEYSFTKNEFESP
ncbi:MAG: exo-alpha-sialidase [Candidatus Wildermuthbacteria bacterium]|nr:exo-alpha-sialidase [Candidatus Wildermuthbacteria bacterium]